MKGRRIIAGMLLVGILITSLTGCSESVHQKKEKISLQLHWEAIAIPHIII